MKAIVQDEYGSPDVLQTCDIDKPETTDDGVLVRVRAGGVNPGDRAIMSGLPYITRPVYGLRKPKNAVRGTDVAGEVGAGRPGVKAVRPTAEAIGWGNGVGWGFSAYALVTGDELARTPADQT